jgi:hypothetical protein
MRGALSLAILASSAYSPPMDTAPPPTQGQTPVVLTVAVPPPASSSATAEVADAAPSSTALAAPPSDLTLADAPSGRWSGAEGNAAVAITSIWGTGDDVYAAGNDSVLRSHDRGRHWLASRGPTGHPTLWGSSADDVYIAGATVLHSTDRGATWTQTAAPPASTTGIWGSGPDDVYVIGSTPNGFIARTQDRGKTWKLLETLQNTWLFAVAGTGPRDVWVAGHGDAGGHTAAVLKRSTDGGASWKNVKLAKPGDTTNEEIRNLCFGPSGTLYASYSYSVWSTADQGRTWARATVPTWPMHADRLPAEVIGLACGGRQVLAGGRNRSFSMTTDGGTTWSATDLDAVWTQPALITLQAMFVAPTGETYLGAEGASGGGGGTLLRRTP